MSTDFLQSLFSNPAILASLSNTLTPAGVLDQSQAYNDQMAKDLAAKTAAASQAATAAGTQYGQAAAAPVPPVDPLQTFMQTLSGGIGTALTGDKGFTQRAGANLDEMHADLIRSRLDNLTALKDTYDKREAAAKAAGDTEGEFKAQVAKQKVIQAAADIVEKQRQINHEKNTATDQTNAVALEGERQKNREALARLTASLKPEPVVKEPKPGFDEQGNYSLKNMVRTTASGRQWVNLGPLTGDAKNAAFAAANQAGIPVPDAAGAAGLMDVNRAQRDIAALKQYILPLVPLDAQGRVAGYANRTLKTISQSDPRMGAFRVWADAAIPVLRATAGSKNLRITQEQVKLAISNLPTMNDNVQTVLNKIGILGTLLDNAESSLIEPDGSTGGTPGSAPTGKERFRLKGGN